MPSRSASSSARWVWLDASVPGPSQMRHVDDQRLGRGVDGSATAVAMCQSRRAAFTVGRQDAAGVAGSYSHQLGGLVQGHVLFCQAVENLKSALFFWGQCHILHDVTAMMGPGHLDQGLTLDVTGTNAFKMICRPDPRWPRQCRPTVRAVPPAQTQLGASSCRRCWLGPGRGPSPSAG